MLLGGGPTGSKYRWWGLWKYVYVDLTLPRRELHSGRDGGRAGRRVCNMFFLTFIHLINRFKKEQGTGGSLVGAGVVG